jgi:hypothetical protein
VDAFSAGASNACGAGSTTDTIIGSNAGFFFVGRANPHRVRRFCPRQ